VEVLEEALVKIAATTTEQLELRTKVMVAAQVQFHLQAVVVAVVAQGRLVQTVRVARFPALEGLVFLQALLALL
jgi:hypothetical protein